MEKCYEENREMMGEMKMEELVKKWILNSGEDHNVEIVLYGMQVIVDGMISIFALLLLGIILKKVAEYAAKKAVVKASPWNHYQNMEPASLRNWMEKKAK